MRSSLLVLSIIVLLFAIVPTSAAAGLPERKWQDESIYYIMTDRFNDGDVTNNSNVNTNNPLAYNGGDFQGIINKLDYLKDMGFTAIDLTPVFDNSKEGYNGYWVKNFYKTDEHFGSLKTFQRLVKEAHKRNLKVIIDFIANNVSPAHPWVNDPSKKSWFHPKQLGNANSTIQNRWINGLPDLNQENPQVKNYLINAAEWWIMKTDIDGYRLVDANYVPVSFWTDFSREIKKEKKDFYLLGDIPISDPAVLKKYSKAGFDSLTNYSLNQNLRKGFSATDRPLKELFSKSGQDPNISGNFLDDPRSTRFTQDIVANKQYPGSRWKMALTYLYSSPGIPIVYYGSEIALNGGKAPDNNRQMNFRADTELIDYITKLGQLRQKLHSLTRGSMEILYENHGMLVFKRVYKNETTVVAINNTKKSRQITLSSNQLKDGKELRGLLNGDLTKSKDKEYTLILDRDNAEIYVLADKSGINLPLIGANAFVCAAFLVFLYFILKRRNRSTKE